MKLVVSTVLALALVLSAALVVIGPMSTPVAAGGPATLYVVPFELVEVNTGTAVWSDDRAYSGSHSVKLYPGVVDWVHWAGVRVPVGEQFDQVSDDPDGYKHHWWSSHWDAQEPIIAFIFENATFIEGGIDTGETLRLVERKHHDDYDTSEEEWVEKVLLANRLALMRGSSEEGTNEVWTDNGWDGDLTPGGPALEQCISDWQATSLGSQTLDWMQTSVGGKGKVDNYVDFIHVGGIPYYGLIKDAIAAAEAGDTIVVHPGQYDESFTIDKSLTMKSTGGKDVTTITGLVWIDLDGGQTVVFGEEDAGFTIDRGNPVPDSGILLSLDNGSEVTISHNTITGSDAGIRSETRTIAGGSTVTIEHNVITDCPGHGIHLDLIKDSTVSIESNQITDNGFDGIYIWRIDDAPKTVTIAGNTITGNVDSGVHITGVFASTLVIEDNAIQDNGAEGIYVQYVWQASTVDIAGNTIGGATEDDGNGAAGVRIFEILYGSTVTIGGDTEAKGNTISHNGRGVPTTGIHIYWVYTSDVIIEYNAITDNQGAGVRIENIGLAIATVTIARNTIADNGEAGIYVDRVYSSRLIIEENSISGNGREEPFTGIHIRSIEDSDVTIEHNTISDNRGAGIYILDILSAVDTVTIARNTITDNTLSGIMVASEVSGSTLVIEENTIRGNCTVPTTEDEDAGIFVGAIHDSEVTIEANIVEDNGTWGIRFSGIGYAPTTVSVLKNTVTGSDVGVYVNDIVESALDILGNVITENHTGVQINQADDSPIAINFNNVFANVVRGLLAGNGEIAASIDATHNWWGHFSGPFHDTNPAGMGNAVSDDVDFTPWLGAAMTDQRTGCTTDRGYGVDAGAETDNLSATSTGGNQDTTVTLAEYADNPTDLDPGFVINNVFFFDVHVGGPPPYPDQLVVEVSCPGGNCAGVVLKWFDGTEWLPVVAPTSVVNGRVQVVLSDTSNPTIEQLTGSPFGLGGDPVPPPQPPTAGAPYPVWAVLLAGLMAGGALLALRRRQTQS